MEAKKVKKESDSNLKEEEKTVELPTIDFFKISFITFLVPLYVCLALFLIFEYLFIIRFSIPVIIHFLLLPGFLFLLYYIYLIILIEFAAFWTRSWNKKSPPKQGVFERILNDVNCPEGKMIKYYHKRGFIVKFPVWFTSKSPFPWLVNRALRRIAHNKIGHNVIYCDSYVGLEFTDIGNNVFIYPTSMLSSHAVNSIFGKLSILEIKIGEGTVFYPGTISGPGVLTINDYVIFPNSLLHKSWRGKPGMKYYQGSPAHPIEPNHLEKI